MARQGRTFSQAHALAGREGINRRTLLKTLGRGMGASLLALSGAPAFLAQALGAAQTTASGTPLKFLFVFNLGGWDPTTVFAPLFGYDSIDMEATATRSEIGNIAFVDSPQRPSVRAFLEQWRARTLFLNGINVPSLAHDVCARLILTGSSSAEQSDWATLLADAQRQAFTLPHLVLSGLSYPGALGSTVSRVGVNGQLDGLLSGALMDAGDLKSGGRPNLLEERLLDSYLGRRLAARAGSAVDSRQATLMEAFTEAHSRAIGLKERQYDMDFKPGYGLFTQIGPAVDALSLGIARCVTLASGGSWDTHADNTLQSGLFEGLFQGLIELMDRLSTTPGEGAGSLADETVVVVLSEMGRTPKLNASGGRDHWPYTSAMLIGPGLTGDRVVGGLDPYYYGLNIDPDSAELYEGGSAITPASLGATLMVLAGLDSQAFLPGVSPLTGMLT